MTKLNDLNSLIEQSLENLILDTDEKHELGSLFGSLSIEQVRYIRNLSFDLVRNIVRNKPSDTISAIRWQEKLIKLIDNAAYHKPVKSSAFFSPDEDCVSKIIDLIENTKKSIDVCVFTISDNRITESIRQAHNNGIIIRIISDNDKVNDKGSDINYLQNNGVAIKLDSSEYHMHHKFALFDDDILLNGSFNWTRSAAENNEENIMITDDINLVTLFQDRFNKLWLTSR